MPGHQAGSLAFGRFLLDLRRHQLSHEGLDVHLPSRAVFVLAVLAQSPREVLAKSTIAARGWPDGRTSDANLMVQVSRLRSVLRRDGDREGWIRTVRGEGYLFDVDVRAVEAPVARPNPGADFDLRLRDALSTLQYFDAESVRRARGIFEQLRRERPHDPLVTLHLALTLVREWYLGEISGREIRSRLPELVAEAHHLAPGDARTHLVEGVAAFTLEYDFAASDESLYRALELEPHDAAAHEYLAYSLMARRRFAAAMHHLNEARLLSPSNLTLATYAGTVHYLARRHRDAAEVFDRVLEMRPHDIFAHCWRAVNAAMIPDRAQAYLSAKVIRDSVGDVPLAHSICGAVAAILGDRREAQESVRWLENKRAAGGNVSPLLMAVVWTHTGETTQALRALRESLADPFPGLCLVAVEPIWDPLRREPGFARILEHLGMAQYAEGTDAG